MAKIFIFFLVTAFVFFAYFFHERNNKMLELELNTTWFMQLQNESGYISEPTGLILINFWASWCAPCRREIPMLNTLSRQGIPVLGFSMDEDIYLANEFMLSNPIVYKTIVGKANEASFIKVYPTTIIVDKYGKQLFINEGEISADALKSIWQSLTSASVNEQ